MSAEIIRIFLDPAERVAIEDAIERLLSFLDGADPDPDIEPWLAGSQNPAFPLDAEGDEGDLEPSLGSLDRALDQSRWSQGDNGCDGLEEEHDGREPQCEDEGAQCDDEGHDNDSEMTLGASETGEGAHDPAWRTNGSNDTERQDYASVPSPIKGIWSWDLRRREGDETRRLEAWLASTAMSEPPRKA